MTTIGQKLLNVGSSSIGSLEWGSHRKELGLQKHIFSEEPFGGSETVCLRDPITRRSRTVELPGPVIYGLENVTFHPGLGILRASGVPIRESLPYYYSGPFLRGRKQRRFTEGLDADATALTLQTNYYHFLLEDLPRLLLLNRAKKVKRLYAGKVRLPGFIREILDLLDIELVTVGRAKAFKKLWFVGKLGDGLAPTQLAVQLLRSAFNVPERTGSSLLYVSRRGAQRELFGETRLENALREIGYRSIFFEEMSFREQIETAASASIMVGPHGAGLANQVFMSRGSAVLEISSDDYANPLFEVLAGERLCFARLVVNAASLDFREFHELVLKTLARLTE